jgi:hypothetical protein
LLFGLSTVALTAIVLGVVCGTTLAGVALGRYLHDRGEGLREPLGVVQGALVGFVALILAFGLTMAVGRYESRRTAVVTEANTIGTTYLRAQTLAEPIRTASMQLLTRYTDERIALSHSVPGSSGYVRAVAKSEVIQRRLWGLAGQAMNGSPTDSAPRLYVETLNEMIDADTSRTASLANRIPDAVMFLQMIVAALAFGVLGLYLALLGRAALPAVIGALMVSLVLLVVFDLDRPERGFITVPATALVAERASMRFPPAAPAPTTPDARRER